MGNVPGSFLSIRSGGHYRARALPEQGKPGGTRSPPELRNIDAPTRAIDGDGPVREQGEWMKAI